MRLIVPGERVIVTSKFRPLLRELVYGSDSYGPPYLSDAVANNDSWSKDLDVLLAPYEFPNVPYAKLDRYLWKGGWPDAINRPR